MGEPLFCLVCASVWLHFDGREAVVGADCKWRVGEGGAARRAGLSMDSVGVLLGCFAFVEFVVFVTAAFPWKHPQSQRISFLAHACPALLTALSWSRQHFS